MFRSTISLILIYLVIGTDAEMNFENLVAQHRHLEHILKKHLSPQEVNFCVDCHRLSNVMPKEIPLIMVSKNTKGLNWYQNVKVDSYVLDLSREIASVLDFIEEIPGWNPRAKFFIIFRRGRISYLLKQLFTKYIINVAILTPVDCTTLKVLTYFPFKNGQLRPKTFKSTTISTLTQENMNNTINLFPKKMPKKWKNASINVTPVFVPPYIMCPTCKNLRGIEFRLLDAVGKSLGIEFKYPGNVSHSWGNKESNGSYTFSLGAVQERKFDLTVGGYRTNSPENIDFDMTYPHMEDDIVMVVHSSIVEPRWISILHIFQSSVWILLLIVLFIIAILFYMFSLFGMKCDFSLSILICLSIVLKVSMATKSLSKAERVLLIFWILYNLLTNTYFESHLLGALNKAHRERVIDSVNDIADKGFKVAVHKKFLKIFAERGHKIDGYIQRNCKVMDSSLESINVSATNARIAAIVMDRLVKFYLPRVFMDPEDGTPTLHIIKEKLMFYPLTMYFSKGFPLYQEINDLMRDFKTRGLTENLYQYASYRNMISFYSFKPFTWKSDTLKLSEMKYLFWMLLIGLFCANVVFICEILWYKVKMKSVRKIK